MEWRKFYRFNHRGHGEYGVVRERLLKLLDVSRYAVIAKPESFAITALSGLLFLEYDAGQGGDGNFY